MSQPTGFVELSSEAVDQTLQALEQAQQWSLTVTKATVGMRGEVPRATAVVEWSFDTARKVLEQQRAYALRLTEILIPEAATAAKQ
jgi:hypothetical protein